jgi:hypothetical protein
MRRRQVVVAVILAAVNLPWVVLWWYVSRPSQPAPESVLVLLMLLVVALVGAIVLPALLIRNLFPRRWMLMLVLAAVNLFWCLRWIEAFNRSEPGDPFYRWARFHFLLMILLSSGVVLGLYRLFGRVLGGRGP